MADYDPMNPVHAGPKSPKIKATIRGGNYTLPYPSIPRDYYPRMPSGDGKPFRTPMEIDLLKDSSEINKDWKGQLTEKVKELPKIDPVPTQGPPGARGELKEGFEQSPMGFPSKPKNNKKPVNKAPVKKAVVMVKKPRPKGD